MNKKIWCFFGVHEYKVIEDGPYEVTWVGTGEKKFGKWYSLQCSCCGKIQYKKVY